MELARYSSVIRPLLVTALLNSAIAVFLHQLQRGGDLGVLFTFSQAIGLTICVCVMAARAYFRPTRPLGLVTVVAAGILVGACGGTMLALVLTGHTQEYLRDWRDLGYYQILLVAALFGGVISYYFLSQQRIGEERLRAADERYRRLETEKQSVETHLRLLQAQVEPHFIFNSLATVLSLMDDDLATGRKMLENLIRFLRESLARSRQEDGTLGQEMALIRAYLGVYQVRMGSRLVSDIEVAEGLESLPLPPMLLQPLVENAILHGLEPLVEGGEIRIAAATADGFLRIAVADTGAGLAARHSEGVGLSNVRERLAGFYDGRARISFLENSPRGLQVMVEIPLDAADGDHS